MLSLPCAASGQEDGVCVALTQISKELLESSSATMQAGGCDSSDCLFCQYRSNSPFHLNAYAGKLTSLLRKRSANGMTLASLKCFIDSPSKQGAALLTAQTVSDHSAGKRQRAASSTGIQAPVSQLQRSAPVSTSPSETADPFQSQSQPQASDDPTDSHSTRDYKAHQAHSSKPLTHPALPNAQLPQAAAATGRVACPFSITDTAEGDADADPATTARFNTKPAGAEAQTDTATSVTEHSLPSAHSRDPSLPADTVDAVVGDETATTTLPADRQGSSHMQQSHSSFRHQPPASASQQSGGSHLPRSHLRYPSQEHSQHHHHHHQQQQQQALHDRLPTEPAPHPQPHSHPHTPPMSNHIESHHLPASIVHAAPSSALTLPPSTNYTSPPPPSPTATVRTTQPRPPSRHSHLDLPRGWTFRPEWRSRPDPAPAELREVLRLPVSRTTSGGAGRCTAARGPGGATVLHGREGHVERGGVAAEAGGSSSSSSSASIVCSLEFSPDGRLLAAGGVDKQIRLYNLSAVLGDYEDDGDDDDWDEELLPPQLRTRQGQDQSGRQGSSGHQLLRRPCDCNCEGTDDEDEDKEGNGSSSLLATVQRMPSKISSVSWSPFLDGVLTVGDYDGVLLQLHIASGHQLADVEAHGGRKIWSVAHSALVPHLVASAADDRTARLWSGAGLSSCIAMLQPNPRASVCSVDFSPTQEHLLALACSDRTAYLYDLRATARGPLAALTHHTRPTSYCRFMGGQRLVTAATDASLALWDISGPVPSVAAEMSQPAVMTADATAAAVATASPLPVNCLHTSCRTESISPVDADFLRTAEAQRLPSVLGDSEPTATASDMTSVLCGLTSGKCGVHKARGPTAPATAAAASGSAAPSTAAARAMATPPTAALHVPAPCRVFRGHRNEKNFVGLTVRAADGLLACGSECSRAFAYHTSWTTPLATMEPGGPAFGAQGRCGGAVIEHNASGGLQHGMTGCGVGGGGGGGGGFVSAVCWQPAEAAALLGLPPLLASATSHGVVSISVLAAAVRG